MISNFLQLVMMQGAFVYTCVHNRKSNPMDLICYKLIKKANYGHIILKYPDLSDHIAKTQVSLTCLHVDNFYFDV